MTEDKKYWVPINAEHKQLMRDCLHPKRVPLLEPWQLKFIQDIMSWNRLSEKQVKMLDNIWEIATAEG